MYWLQLFGFGKVPVKPLGHDPVGGIVDGRVPGGEIIGGRVLGGGIIGGRVTGGGIIGGRVLGGGIIGGRVTGGGVICGHTTWFTGTHLPLMFWSNINPGLQEPQAIAGGNPSQIK